MLDIKGILREIKKRKAKRIFLQIPEGLKTKALDMVKELEGAGLKIFVSCEPCYGACDLRDAEAKRLGCDLILHVGHSELPKLKTKIPVVYEDYRIDADPVPLLLSSLEKLKPYKIISLVTTLQYINSLSPAMEFLKSKGKRICIGTPLKAKHPGQILGCDYSAAEPLEKLVDCFLFLGTGRFHPLGLAMNVKKPVLFLDFEKSEISDLTEEREKEQRLRMMHIEEAKGYRNFGILVSTKPGQLDIKTAESIKKELEDLGKNAFVLVFDEIEPGKLMGLQIDCLVNCACPRLAEDSERLEMPILNPHDIDLLEEKKGKPSYE